MAKKIPGTIRTLDFPFESSPSGGFMEVYAREERHNAYVSLYGYTPELDSPDRTECTALFTVRGLTQLTFGYPNEDAFWRDPRSEEEVLGHGVNEIIGSDWFDNLSDYNRASYGSDLHLENKRHFFIGSKDSSVQLLAREIELDIFTGSEMHTDARSEALRRLDSYPEP